VVQGIKMPKKAIAKRDRRGKGRGKGRGAVNPTRRMAAERLGDKGGRKPAQWAWRVVFMSHLRELSYRSIEALFRAEGKHISKKYVGECLKDYKKHGNPDHRNEQKAFRLESLAPVQSTWLKDLLLETPDLFFFEIAQRFQRQCAPLPPPPHPLSPPPHPLSPPAQSSRQSPHPACRRVWAAGGARFRRY